MDSNCDSFIKADKAWQHQVTGYNVVPRYGVWQLVEQVLNIVNQAERL